MTLSQERLKEIFAALKDAADTEDGAVIRGINMEGPFLDVKRRGLMQKLLSKGLKWDFSGVECFLRKYGQAFNTCAECGWSYGIHR